MPPPPKKPSPASVTPPKKNRIIPIAAGVGFILLVLIVVKCSSKTPEQIKAAAAKHEAETTGRLVVKSNRPNTTVEAIRLPAAGETPSAPRKGSDDGAAEQTLTALPPGRYSVTARSSGWPDLQQETVIEIGRATDLTVKFKTGSLRVDSEPPGAVVKWGEADLGKTPLLIAQLPPGESQLVVQYPSWPAVPFKATITEGQEATATVHLPHGKLLIDSFPAGAPIRMGGRAIGQTPLTLPVVAAGTHKVLLKPKDFPQQEVSIVVEDRGDAKVYVELGAGFPPLDPAALIRDVWVADNPDKLAPPTTGLSGPYQPQNGVIRNLNRKRVYEGWQNKNYRYAATIKTYDKDSGQIEFEEKKSELTKYRVLTKLSPGAHSDQALVAQLIKGATFTFYGRLVAVEEARWPAKMVSLEFFEAEALH